MPLDASGYALSLAAALLVGLSKTGVPGVALPAILMMTRAFAGNEKLSVGAMLPLLLVGDVLAVACYRRHAQWDRLLGLFPAVLAGMVPAVAVLYLADDRVFKLILIVNALKVPVYPQLGLLSDETLRFGLTFAPAVAVGALAGRRVFAVIPQKVFDLLVLAFAAVAALQLVAGN